VVGEELSIEAGTEARATRNPALLPKDHHLPRRGATMAGVTGVARLDQAWRI